MASNQQSTSNLHQFQRRKSAKKRRSPVSTTTSSSTPSSEMATEEERTPTPSTRPVSFAPTIESEDSIDPDKVSLKNWDLGLMCHWVKGAGMCRAQIRLTGYYKTTGRVVEYEGGVVNAESHWVWPNFRFRRHVFGRQEIVCPNVTASSDMLLVVKLYRDYSDHVMPADLLTTPVVSPDWGLAGFAVLPLIVPKAGKARRAAGYEKEDMNSMVYNTGIHTLPLYRGPIPPVTQMPLEAHVAPMKWERVPGVKIRISLHDGEGILATTTDTDEEVVPNDVFWRRANHPPTHFGPFTSTDAVDIYIDSARFLPDITTVSKISFRIVDRNYNRISADYTAYPQLETDCFNPDYGARFEIRQVALPPTSMLVLKLYTVSRLTKELNVLGYAFLHMFVVLGSDRQPTVDKGMQISLNAGCHQLRLLARAPDGRRAICAEIERHLRPLPAASLLVRLRLAPTDVDGVPLKIDDVPEDDWLRTGLLEPMPAYSSGVYTSITCDPTRGERLLMESMCHRSKQTIKHITFVLSGQAAEEDAFLWAENSLSTFGKEDAAEINLTYVSIYDPSAGFKVYIESATNIPWPSFTLGFVTVAPPRAYFQGAPKSKFDPPKFLNRPNTNGPSKHVEWINGIFRYPNRCMMPGMTIVVQLHEVIATTVVDRVNYSLRAQAWTAFQVFRTGYVAMERMAVPLFMGSVPLKLLEQRMCTSDLAELLKDLVRRDEILPLGDAFLSATICDGRRHEELKYKADFPLNASYFVSEDVPARQNAVGPPVVSVLPQGPSRELALDELAQKYREMVYAIHEDLKKEDEPLGLY